MSRGKENRRCCTQSAPSPSQSRLTPCQLPRKGSFSRSGGKQSKTSPFRGSWHRAAMTERVLSVPPALFLSGLALSVTFGDTSPKGRGSGETIHFVLLSGSLPPCQGLSLWESCQGRSALTERASPLSPAPRFRRKRRCNCCLPLRPHP